MVGATPSFSQVHVVRALLLLKKKKMGRKNLVKALGVGEGSVRTILKRLRGRCLITSGKMGHELTEAGEIEAGKYLKRFTMPERFESVDIDLTRGDRKEKCLIVVSDSADKIRSGMEQRDIAFSVGASGALVVLFKDGRLEFPTTDIKLPDFPDTEKRLMDLDLSENDVVVISSGETYTGAEDGAIAIAMSLIDQRR
jgi:Mn-dependent DtxR family transcriptional regulator